jgi:hypothetical protein
MGLGSAALITPNQTLTPFFAALSDRSQAGYASALATAVTVALGFVALALVGTVDLVRHRRVSRVRPTG